MIIHKESYFFAMFSLPQRGREAEAKAQLLRNDEAVIADAKKHLMIINYESNFLPCSVYRREAESLGESAIASQ